MEEEIWRVTGLILEAPLTRRNRRELLYCGLGGLAGALGFYILVVLLVAGLTVSVSIIGTVVGLLLIILTLRLSRRIGALHRRLSNRLLGPSRLRTRARSPALMPRASHAPATTRTTPTRAAK